LENTLQLSDQFAVHYDAYIAKSNWYGPQMLFGLLYEYVQPQENILDLGIGTGLSAWPFHLNGQKIYGVDGSKEMIKICRDKAFTEDIKQADLNNFKSPFGLALFDHVISVGVFHLIENLTSIFSEVSRSLRKGGIFGFTIDEYKEINSPTYSETSNKGIYSKINSDSEITVFKHTSAYILGLIEHYHFTLLRKTEFLAYRNIDAPNEYYFSVYVISKNS
jgi:predicted TPR repeat methyltransferase